jgi:hypothetical protein
VNTLGKTTIRIYDLRIFGHLGKAILSFAPSDAESFRVNNVILGVVIGATFKKKLKHTGN